MSTKHDCREELRHARLKLTPARLAVIEFLENTEKPADVEMILEKLKKAKIKADPATIYRILDIFHEKGLVQKIEFGEGKYRWEKSDKHHHHLICTNCGRVEDVEGEYLSVLEKQIKNQTGFSVKSHSLEFFGLCRECGH